MGTTAPAVKAAIVTLLPTLIDDVEVVYGARAGEQDPDVIGVQAIATEVARPTLGNSPRSREETHTVTVIASTFAFASDDQQACTERAYQMIDVLAERLRTEPTLALGAHIDAWVSAYELDEHLDDGKLQDKGRYAQVTATVQVLASRI